jgi:hypothetical protein
MSDRKLARPWKRSRRHCRKCGIHTCDVGEYYMLHDELWQSVINRWKIPRDEYGEAGMICIACFEALLGRKLTKQDFTDCPVNDLTKSDKSYRLRDRLTSEVSRMSKPTTYRAASHDGPHLPQPGVVAPANPRMTSMDMTADELKDFLR